MFVISFMEFPMALTSKSSSIIKENSTWRLNPAQNTRKCRPKKKNISNSVDMPSFQRIYYNMMSGCNIVYSLRRMHAQQKILVPSSSHCLCNLTNIRHCRLMPMYAYVCVCVWHAYDNVNQTGNEIYIKSINYFWH